MPKCSICALFTLSITILGSVGFSQQSPVGESKKHSADAAQPDSAAFSGLTPDTNGSLSQLQMQQLFRAVADKDLENDKRLRDYTYIERDDEHKLDGKGDVQSTEVRTYEVMELYGEHVQRLIAKDDKPLDSGDADKEENRIRKIIDKRKNESEDARRKREIKDAKDREQGRQFVREVADAYNFHLVGTESISGRHAWVIDAQPRPGYEPHTKDAKFLPKFRFRAWIDKKDTQWAKFDIECIDTVSVGFFLARIHKGSRIAVEQTRVNDEVWLPRHVVLKIDARIALIKGLYLEQDMTFRDYKKFRAKTKIVDLGDLKP